MANDNKHSLKNLKDSEKQYQQHLKRETRRKILKSINKNMRRNHQPKPARKKNWVAQDGEDWDELSVEDERIMPRDEGERRRTLEKQAARRVKVQDEPAEAPTSMPAGERGLVIEIGKGLYRVELPDRIIQCHIRGTLKAQETGYTNPVAVGDEVLISQNGTGNGVIETVLPRRSVLARPDVFRTHLEQVIVANADQWLIVSSWQEPPLWLELLDRYLIAAARTQLPVLVCLNKVDLAEDRADCEATLRPYRSLGYSVILTSARTGEGLETLRGALRNRLTVLAGLSGVGKSSLLSAVQPDLALRVGRVSEHSGEGRHTTTQATLIRLDQEIAVVDTPGIREFGLSGLHRHELAGFFPEIEALALNCRFKNCTHLSEPDCAIRAGVQQQKIAASRYHSYQKIYETLPA